jgi:hypothetical protein
MKKNRIINPLNVSFVFAQKQISGVVKDRFWKFLTRS